MTEHRRPIIAGNWKMHKTVAEAKALAEAVRRGMEAIGGVDVVLCPPFTSLAAVSSAISGSKVALGAQDMYWEAEGAFTGEVSTGMLMDAGCKYVIVGHSERRSSFGETNEGVRRKSAAALSAGLCPIVCVGETLEEREKGIAHDVVREHFVGAVEGKSAEDVRKIVFAYEPVWAIGTGKTATDEQAQEMHAFLRGLMEESYDLDTALGTRIQYGGSVKPDNVAGLMTREDIDGALIGGASLKADVFLEILTRVAG
ncbi:MAG: triose-phosphate isomerase [Candidatus Eisenbacteria sp.]|nr:triose-phosphate isomerase [Candidatus Eisenbacteria bacterium]